MKDPTHYEILQVSPSAAAEEIKSKYRKLAIMYHPDKQSGVNKAQATEIFQSISNAYYVLSDGERRRQYDAELTGQSSSVVPAGYGGYFGSSRRGQMPNAFDLFQSVFGVLEEILQHQNQHYHQQMGMSSRGNMPASPLDSFFGSSMSMMQNSHHSSFSMAISSSMTSFSHSFFSSGASIMHSSFADLDPQQAPHADGIRSQRLMSRTVNGVTESVFERINRRGETSTIVEQTDNRSLPRKTQAAPLPNPSPPYYPQSVYSEPHMMSQVRQQVVPAERHKRSMPYDQYYDNQMPVAYSRSHAQPPLQASQDAIYYRSAQNRRLPETRSSHYDASIQRAPLQAYKRPHYGSSASSEAPEQSYRALPSSSRSNWAISSRRRQD